MNYTVPPPGPQAEPGDWPIAPRETGPLPGWYAVCVRRLRERDRQYAYFLRFKPVATAGYSIYIYNITLDEASRVPPELGMPPLPAASGSGHDKVGDGDQVRARQSSSAIHVRRTCNAWHSQKRTADRSP